MIEFQAVQVHSSLFGLPALSNDRVAGVAVMGNGITRFTDMAAIAAAKTTRKDAMPDIVWTRLPGCLHLRKEIVAKDVLGFRDRLFNLLVVFVICIFLAELFGNLLKRLGL
jgi:hypothetical protein